MILPTKSLRKTLMYLSMSEPEHPVSWCYRKREEAKASMDWYAVDNYDKLIEIWEMILRRARNE